MTLVVSGWAVGKFVEGQLLYDRLRKLLLKFAGHRCDQIYLLPINSVKNVGEKPTTFDVKMKDTFRFVIKTAVRLFLQSGETADFV